MTGATTPWADGNAVVVDLGFGDAGKGVTVDLLCARRRFGAVVRANGGAQAAHNVVAPDGRHHTFAQFGSGTLAPGGPVPTHLSRLMVVDPFALAAEAGHLASLGVPDPFALVTVDRRALISTPWHRAANQTRERARGEARHGSCGMGVGETVAYALARPEDAPTAGDCARPDVLRRKLRRLADHLHAVRRALEPPGAARTAPGTTGAGTRFGDTAAGSGETSLGVGPRPEACPDVEECVEAYLAFARRVRLVDEDHLPRLLARSPVVFEGAQGVLLDEWHGFHPYTTWSTTTTANPLALLAEAGRPGDARRIGVVRAYTTRHGAGPLVAEDPGLGAVLTEAHNGAHPWQGAFRVGHFDAVAHRYALAATGGVDSLVVTHADAPARAGGRLRWCTGYTAPDGSALEPVPAPAPAPTRPGASLTGAATADAAARLDRQERLARALLAARPVLAPAPDSPAEAVGEELGLALEAVFSGPTRADAHVPSRV
ncbi:adenylosuccinate synthetase [Nocardiopsis alborubida]|uniref:Adenylosuccinate synthetase n=1 Tax=Nocardiopsis alborubida TaxID=146802 RepID=A0A7X6MAD0_9ACTN|nr:adenylosuccinate synthetase [Nocardiopsis alborubida]NKY97681.1 adenylosuccinate synthetase [Nocardiopsis alborubida]